MKEIQIYTNKIQWRELQYRNVEQIRLIQIKNEILKILFCILSLKGVDGLETAFPNENKPNEKNSLEFKKRDDFQFFLAWKYNLSRNMCSL